MRNQKAVTGVVLAVVVGLAGCLQSPLFNHLDADRLALDSLRRPLPAGCAFHLPKAKLCASLEWTIKPAHDEKAEFRLRFWDIESGTEHGPYVNPALKVASKLWMPSMGHGSSPIRLDQEKDAAGGLIPGVYLAQDVYFSMDGDWEIWVQLKEERKVIEQAMIDYEFH